MSAELVKVDFHGDVIEATRDDGGNIWVSLRRCCENLGIAVQAQHRKLTGKPWACITEMVIHDVTGRQQVATMIDLFSLPAWLFSIDARKVNDGVRGKLVQYQNEAAKVLAAHFVGAPAAAASSGDHVIDSLIESRKYVDAMIETRREQIQLGRQIESTWQQVGLLATHVGTVEKKADTALGVAEAAMHHADRNYGYFSVLGYARRRGWEMPVKVAQTHGAKLSARCRREGVEVHKISDPRYGQVNVYPESMLDDYFAAAR